MLYRIFANNPIRIGTITVLASPRYVGDIQYRNNIQYSGIVGQNPINVYVNQGETNLTAVSGWLGRRFDDNQYYTS